MPGRRLARGRRLAGRSPGGPEVTPRPAALLTPLVTVKARLERAPAHALGFRVALVVGLFFLSVITRGHFAGSGDAPHYMMIAHSIAFDRDLDLRNNYADPENPIGRGTLPPDLHAREGVGGLLRPVHDVGLPLLAAPYYYVAAKVARLVPLLPEGVRRKTRLDEWIALRQLMSMLVIGIAAVLAAAALPLGGDASTSKTAAALGTVLWSVSPPLFPHSFMFIPEVPTALLAVALVLLLQRRALSTHLRAFAGGCLVGYLVLLHVRNVGLSFGLSVLYLWEYRRQRRFALAFAIGLALVLGARLALNEHLWGAAVFSPHVRAGGWPGLGDLTREAGLRFGGLLLDQRHGLLPYAPIYLLAPLGWVLLRRQDRPLATAIAVLVTSYCLPLLLPVTNVHGWRGGWSPPARFLVPVLPLVAIGVAKALDTARARWLAGAIVLAQLALDAVFWWRPMLLWNEGAGPGRAFEVILGGWLAKRLPSWRPDGDGLFLLTGGFCALWLGATFWLGRRLETQQRPGAA